MKNTKTKIKCVGGNNLLYLLCLIYNTMPQLEQSSLQPSTDLQHRHLQTTSYNHLLYSTSSSPEKENPSSNRLGTSPRRGLRSQKGLRPFNPLQRIGHAKEICASVGTNKGDSDVHRTFEDDVDNGLFTTAAFRTETKGMCIYCREVHSPSKCAKVTDVNARRSLLRKYARYFICLEKGHKNCKSSKVPKPPSYFDLRRC